MTLVAPSLQVALDNCDREPIHIPGHIQGHGVLLAFSAQGKLAWASANAAALLGVDLPALGQAIAAHHFGGQTAVQAAIAQELAAPPSAVSLPELHEAVCAGGTFDLIVHRCENAVVAEFERQVPSTAHPAAFAIKAHRGMVKLRRQRSIQALLEAAVLELQELSGFDRVMAYRFGPDGSGDVVAEACRNDLEPFLGLRFPASDIPAQARRLYLINTLRLVADVHCAPVPVAGAGAEPLEMSHCVLRSVSPVHIEYLTNMGVGASMSVSIVVEGQLWGLLACHHMSPRQVPFAVRMTCDVLAQVLAANLQSITASEHAKRIACAAGLRARLIEQTLLAQDLLSALSSMAPKLLATFGAGAIVFADEGKVSVHGELALPAARALVRWLEGESAQLEGQMLAVDSLAGVPSPVADELGAWRSLLALRFNTSGDGWLILLRHEQVQEIAWAGRPGKETVIGPFGPRLSPRGSFEVWRETVRGQTVPWSASDLEIARQLLAELMRATAARNAELNRAKNQLLAVLGHDLRTPLQTISMAAHVLERGADGVKLGRRIQTSSTRMQRLISQVLDMSRLQSGMDLGFQLAATDLTKLLDDVIEETGMAYPDASFVKHLPPSLMADVDADRMAQLLANLVSNARHHGAPGESILVQLAECAGSIELDVSNAGPPIPSEVAAHMFNAFKRQSIGNVRNKDGLGLGLYIAREIALGHGGTLGYAYADSRVVFSARFPTHRPAA